MPISFYVKSPFVLVVDPALPVKTVPELIKYAKESATPLNYSSPGAGVAQHLSMEFMKQRFGLKHDARALSQHAAVDHRHRGRPRQHRLCRSRRLAAADPRRQAARARGFVARRGCRRCPTCRRSPKPPAPRISRRCPGTCCLRPRPRPRRSSTRLHQRDDARSCRRTEMNKASRPRPHPDRPASVDGSSAYIKSEQEKWGSLVRKLGLEGSQ